jgi:AcrR family transcriptional regulator
MATRARTRRTAEERREAVLASALHEFATKGLYGASTQAIARGAGISEAYLFRLFGTKHGLYLATARRSMALIHDTMVAASAGLSGHAALQAMGAAYRRLLAENGDVLKMQSQCLVTADDPAIRAELRDRWRALTEHVERASGADSATISRFFAIGMLLNNLTSMRVFEEPEPWSQRLLDGCFGWLEP